MFNSYFEKDFMRITESFGPAFDRLQICYVGLEIIGIYPLYGKKVMLNNNYNNAKNNKINNFGVYSQETLLGIWKRFLKGLSIMMQNVN